MGRDPLVSTLVLRRCIAKFAELGLARDELLRAAGVPELALELTRMRAPWVLVEDLFEAAERISGDDRVGFHAGSRYEATDLVLPELLVFAAKDLGEAMRRLQSVQRLFGDAERGILLTDPPRVRYELDRPPRRALLHLHEHAMAMFVHFLRVLSPGRFVPVEVSITHARAGDTAEYERFFGCPVRFGAGVTEFRMRPEDLALPVATSNPFFARHFERAAAAELAALDPDVRVRDRVRAALAEDLDAARLAESSLESTARRLHVSARTLQRALAGEATTFAAELDGVRREAAERLIVAGADIAEVSWRLGFAEPPVFHRAFKRWTGSTPEQFRRR